MVFENRAYGAYDNRAYANHQKYREADVLGR